MSNDSFDDIELDNNDKICFICFDNKDVIKTCNCKGTNYGVHRKCLEKWILESKKDSCLICKHKYEYEPIFEPSLSRYIKIIYHKFYDCKNIEFSRNEDILLSLLVLSIGLFIIIFIVNIFIGTNYFSLICWIIFFTQIISLLIFKRCDETLNVLCILNFKQIITSIIIYSYLGIMVTLNENTCQLKCVYEKMSCNNTCSYFNEYSEIRSNYLNAVTNQSIILLLVLTMVLLYNFKELLYYKSIKELK